MNATIIRGPEEGSSAPGYYSVLFEGPDGIRLEVCFVPGAGLLEDLRWLLDRAIFGSMPTSLPNRGNL
jgi:hypothetical protein